MTHWLRKVPFRTEQRVLARQAQRRAARELAATAAECEIMMYGSVSTESGPLGGPWVARTGHPRDLLPAIFEDDVERHMQRDIA